MRKFLVLFFVFNLICSVSHAAPPTRIYELPNLVYLNMFTSGGNFEIFYAIIGFIAVYMVNYFVRSKFSPKVFFHNITMIINLTVFPVLGRIKDISISVFGFTTFPVRIFLSKIFSLKRFAKAVSMFMGKLFSFVPWHTALSSLTNKPFGMNPSSASRKKAINAFSRTIFNPFKTLFWIKNNTTCFTGFLTSPLLRFRTTLHRAIFLFTNLFIERRNKINFMAIQTGSFYWHMAWLLLLVNITTHAIASPPQRIFSYIDGTTIRSDEVEGNEDEIFQYLQTGVDTIRTDGVDAITEIKSTIKSGSDATLITGTATAGMCGQFDSNGDLVSAGAACGSGGVTAYDDIGDPDANGSIAFAGFTNLWTSTGASGSLFTVGNATNGTLLEIDKSGKIVLGGSTSKDSMAIRPMCTRTVCSSTTSFRGDSCDYVADGTDDDVQIQAAINDVVAGTATGALQAGAQGKGNVCLSEGTYTIGATIYVRPGIALEGTSFPSSTVLKAKNSLNTTGSGGAPTPLIAFNESSVNPSAGVTIRNIYFDGNNSNNDNTIAIDTQTGSIALWDLWIEDSLFFDFGSVDDSDGVLTIDDTWGFRLWNSHIENSEGYAIIINNGAEKTEGATIIGNKIVYNDRGILLDDVDAAMIIGNELEVDDADQYAISITNGGSGNIINANKFWGGQKGISIGAGSTANILNNNIFAGLAGAEIDDGGTNTQRIGNRGDDNQTNINYTNTWTATMTSNEDFWVNSSGGTGNFRVDSDTGTYLFAVVGALNEVRLGDGEGSNYGYFDIDGDLRFSGTADYLVDSPQYAFRYVGDEDAGLAFGTGFEFRDTNANVSARINLSGTFQLLTQATAPATCTVGEMYFDTSGAFCACTATNTWENTVATGTCS